jgi:hypothetical protein
MRHIVSQMTNQEKAKDCKPPRTQPGRACKRTRPVAETEAPRKASTRTPIGKGPPLRRSGDVPKGPAGPKLTIEFFLIFSRLRKSGRRLKARSVARYLVCPAKTDAHSESIRAANNPSTHAHNLSSGAHKKTLPPRGSPHQNHTPTHRGKTKDDASQAEPTADNNA